MTETDLRKELRVRLRNPLRSRIGMSGGVLWSNCVSVREALLVKGVARRTSNHDVGLIVSPVHDASVQERGTPRVCKLRLRVVIFGGAPYFVLYLSNVLDTGQWWLASSADHC
jgi:hypothetical protein